MTLSKVNIDSIGRHYAFKCFFSLLVYFYVPVLQLSPFRNKSAVIHALNTVKKIVSKLDLEEFRVGE